MMTLHVPDPVGGPEVEATRLTHEDSSVRQDPFLLRVDQFAASLSSSVLSGQKFSFRGLRRVVLLHWVIGIHVEPILAFQGRHDGRRRLPNPIQVSRELIPNDPRETTNFGQPHSPTGGVCRIQVSEIYELHVKTGGFQKRPTTNLRPRPSHSAQQLRQFHYLPALLARRLCLLPEVQIKCQDQRRRFRGYLRGQAVHRQIDEVRPIPPRRPFALHCDLERRVPTPWPGREWTAIGSTARHLPPFNVEIASRARDKERAIWPVRALPFLLDLHLGGQDVHALSVPLERP